MSTSKIGFDEITNQLLNYLKEIGYSECTLNHYESNLRNIKRFITKKNLKTYDANASQKYIESILSNRNYSDIKRSEKDKIRCAHVLLEYKNFGKISYRCITKKNNFNSALGSEILKFLEYRKAKGISYKTRQSNEIYLARFHEYLVKNKITSFKKISSKELLTFIKTLAIYSESTMHCTFCTLRTFLRYLYDNKIIEKELSHIIPSSRYKKELKIPTTYTLDEIKAILNVIDCGNPKGKRDYAMILLVATLGLRASDVCQLKFENINWKTNKIVITQKKTKEYIEFPLLSNVGNSIINYLKYSRPKSESDYIFLHLIGPYKRLKEPTLHSIVTKYMNLAGITNYQNKKHGPHALRHSLAYSLLENRIPLPVISKVLGHRNIESTKAYLKIDLKSLRQCAIPVLQLNTKDFFLKGGVFND